MTSDLHRITASPARSIRRSLRGAVYLLTCSVVAGLSGGCERDRGPSDTAAGSGDHDAKRPLVMVDEGHVVHAEPNVLHTVQVRLRNTSDTTVVGAAAKLPCSCHIVDALPQEFPPDGAFDTTFKVLTPLAGSREYEIEFYDRERNLVGAAAFRIEVAGAVPRLLRVPPSIQLVHVAREQKSYAVGLEAVEASGAAEFVEGADFGEQPGIVALAPRLVHSLPLNQNYVLQRYQVPVQIETTAVVEFAAKLQLHMAGGGDDAQIPVQVRVLPRAHVAPSAIEFPAASASRDVATFEVIARVEGDEYVVSDVYRELLAIEPSGEGDSTWSVTCLRPVAGGTSTNITLTSGAGDTMVLPVLWR